MAMREPSIAKHYSVSFNPRTSEAEAAAVKFMEDLLKKGYSQKQIILDAVIRADGKDPADFPASGLTAQALESFLERYTDKVIEGIKSAGGFVQLPPDEPGSAAGSKASPFAKRFAKSFANHQAQAEED